MITKMIIMQAAISAPIFLGILFKIEIDELAFDLSETDQNKYHLKWNSWSVFMEGIECDAKSLFLFEIKWYGN